MHPSKKRSRHSLYCLPLASSSFFFRCLRWRIKSPSKHNKRPLNLHTMTIIININMNVMCLFWWLKGDPSTGQQSTNKFGSPVLPGSQTLTFISNHRPVIPHSYVVCLSIFFCVFLCILLLWKKFVWTAAQPAPATGSTHNANGVAGTLDLLTFWMFCVNIL